MSDCSVTLSPSVLPADCQLVPVVAVAAALNVSERMCRSILAEEGLPLISLGARSVGVRLSAVRELLAKRERVAA